MTNKNWEDEFNDDSAAPEETSEKKAPAEDFARMLDASFKRSTKKLSVGDKIRGEILVLGKEDVFVSTGAQHDGVVQRRDLLDEAGNCPYKTGDVIELYVVSVKGSDIRLSKQPTAKNLADGLEDAFDMMLPVSGKVTEVVKGGFRVQLQGSKLAFCPISQIDSTFVETPDEYIGKRFEFRITQFSEGGRNIVVSRRKLLDEQKDLVQGSWLAEHKAGDLVSGKIKRLETFGAFVEVAPGVEGLAHISELAWSRVGHPSEVVTVGQVVDAKVLKIESNEGKTRISLSIKQTMQREAAPNPWDEVAKKFPVGTAVKGRVERKEHYGLFIKIADGVTGLFPKARAHEQPEFNYDKVRIGDEVMVQIAELRIEERRISLQSPKDPESDEWKTYVAPKAEGASGLGTLGGALGEQLRKAMEAKGKKKA